MTVKRAPAYQFGYHLSVASAHDQIRRLGLVPSKNRDAPWVYFWTKEEYAVWFVESQHSDDDTPLLIWKVNLKGLELFVDPETEDMEVWGTGGNLPPNESGIVVVGPVAPSRLVSVRKI